MDEDIIKKLHSEGKSLREIAKQLGISKSTVQRRLKPINKSWLNPTWSSLSRNEEGPVDAFGAIPAPDAETLLSLNTDTIFACTDWIAKSVAKAELKVLVSTAAHQKAPRSPTLPYQAKSQRLQRIQKAVEVREVVNHPSIELLDRPNNEMSRWDLFYFIDSQLSLAGDAYVRKIYEEGLPVSLYPLLTANVDEIVQGGLVVGYRYRLGSTEESYNKDEIIHFKMPNPNNPYLKGWSPTRAVYERVLLAKNEIAYLNSLFRNQARPDSIVKVKGGVVAGELERIQKELTMRFRQGGIGGPWAVDAEDIDVQNLSWSPKDVMSVDLYRWTKLQICNAFSLNVALFDTESSNRAVATEARRMSQENAVEPRLRLIEEKINCDLLPDFDERLSCEFINIVEEDQDFDLQKRVQYLEKGVYSIDEVRKMEGLPPLQKDSKDTLI